MLAVGAWPVTHVASGGAPVSHAALVALSVLGLWVAIAGGVVAAEALFDRIG